MTRKVFGTIYLFLALPISFVSAKDWSSLAIQVDGSTQRTLSDSEGNPIFWQADTAWEIFHRLNITEVEYYLADRAAKGFNVIYGAILAEEDGLTVPNQNGDLPFIDYDPRKPNEPYFHWVDTVIDMAAKYRITIALVPACSAIFLWQQDGYFIRWSYGIVSRLAATPTSTDQNLQERLEGTVETSSGLTMPYLSSLGLEVLTRPQTAMPAFKLQ